MKIIKKRLIFVLLFTLIFPTCSAFATVSRVTLLIDGNPDDEGFNRACITGLETVKKRYPSKIKTTIVNARNDNRSISNLIDNVAQNSDLVIVTVPDHTEQLRNIVPNYPAVTFVAFDKTDIAGVRSIAFREEEGAFLAGALAAMLTKRTDIERITPSNKVGLILGKDDFAMSGFKKGYVAGAWYIDKKVEVIIKSVGNFTDAEKSKNIAIDMKKQGASVIFTAAGAAGLGAIKAAEENGYWVIGVDKEQEEKYPEAVLVSVVKRGGHAVYKIVSDFVEGIPIEDNISIGLVEDCINLSTWTRESKTNLPTDVRNKLNEIANKIERKLLIIK